MAASISSLIYFLNDYFVSIFLFSAYSWNLSSHNWHLSSYFCTYYFLNKSVNAFWGAKLAFLCLIYFSLLKKFFFLNISLDSSNLGRMKGKFYLKNFYISGTVLSSIKNWNMFSKLARIIYLKLFRKYWSLFSYPLQLSSLISSFNEAALSFPISIN